MRNHTRNAAAAAAALVQALSLAIAGCAEAPEGPLRPLLGAVETPTTTATQVLRGTKQASTAIEVSVGGRDPIVVLLDEETQFAVEVALVEGDNAIVAVAVDGAGRRSVDATELIVLDTVAPAPPVLAAAPPRTALAEVTVAGTHAAGDEVVVNGAPLAGGGTAFDVTLALDVGANLARFATRDDAGNESAVEEIVIERFTEVPFTVDAPVAALVNVGSIALTGTRGEGVEVALDGAVVVAADAALGVGGAWSVADVPLVEGSNTFTLTGSFPGEPATAVEGVIDVQADFTAPAFVVIEPVIGSLVTGALQLSGTADDTNGVFLSACVGLDPALDALACSDDADFTDVAVTAGAFSTTFDLTGDALLDDGQRVAVFVRAVDGAGNSADEAQRPALLFRAPIVVDEATGTVNALDLARPTTQVSGAVPAVRGALAWTNAAGDAGLADDDRESPAAVDVGWSPTDVPLATANAARVRVASNAGVTHVVWIEGGDLMYARADGNAQLVVDGSVDPVTSADVAFDAEGAGAEAVVAFTQGDDVLRAASSTDGAGVTTFAAPEVVSDAITLLPSDVVFAPGGVALAWLETTDRDGALDDADVVLVARAGGATGAPVLVSESQGAFTDAASAAPRLTLLADGDVIAGWIDDDGAAPARGVIARVDIAGAPIAGVPVDVTGAAAGVTGGGAVTDLSLAATADTLLVGWLDDGAVLLNGAAAPALVVRRGPLAALGAPLVVSSGAASSPSGFLDDDEATATLAWIEAGDALLFVVELP